MKDKAEIFARSTWKNRGASHGEGCEETGLEASGGGGRGLEAHFGIVSTGDAIRHPGENTGEQCDI